MSKILFSHSYFLRFDPKQWKMQQPFPPLGTLMAAAVVKEAGYEVALFDTMFARGPEELLSSLSETNPAVFVLYDDGFNYLTKMCLTNMREAAFEMCKMAKSHGAKVVVCSSDSTDRYEMYLEAGADAVIAGEGEITLVNLLDAWKNQVEDLSNIEGIIWKKSNLTTTNRSRLVMKDLDQLPMASWELINIEPYRNAWMNSKGYFSINMYTTRGCPYHCNWCAKPIYGNRYNARSPQRVIQEISYLQKKFGITHIWFCDDIFGLKPGWVNTFAEELQQQGVKIRFKIQSRVDLLLAENNIAALARAGCDEVWVGAESGSQKILDAMDKGTRIEQIQEATTLLKKHNIKPCFFIQFGYRGETLDDINATIKMVTELMPADIGVSVSYPLPGTKFYEMVKEELKSKENWKDSDELALMFNNTYPPQFYKILHRYLHRKYRSKQALESLEQFVGGNFSRSNFHLKRSVSYLYQKPLAWFMKRRLAEYTSNSIS
ncbi:radical SAM protein [soil metagenome]